MKAIVRYGQAFGGYTMRDVPEPTCGPEDIILEIKAAAICGADMKHWRVDNGSDEFNSIRGHEFAGEIVQVGEKVTDWKVGQRVVSDNSAHVCGVCPACEMGDFLCCEEKVNLGLFSVQIARLMGAVNIVMVGLDEDVDTRFPVALEVGATHVVNGSKEDVVKRCTEICGRDNLGLVIECSGANIALKQAIEMTRPNAEIVRVGMGFKPLEFSINDITSWNKSLIGHMAYDSTSWRNAIRLLESGQIKVQPLITHRLGLSEYEKGFDAMASKEAIKVIFHYDFED